MEAELSRRAFLGVRDAAPASAAGSEEQDLNMCGVLVHAMPKRFDDVQAALARMPGVVVHRVLPQGRLIVTVEDTAAGSAIDTLSAMHAVPGVVAAALVYHQFEAARSDERREEETRS